MSVPIPYRDFILSSIKESMELGSLEITVVSPLLMIIILWDSSDWPKVRAVQKRT
jgi:hypothetical protein